MKLTIYHTNDMHNNSAALEYLKKVNKDKFTLFLDSGDALKGSSTLFYLNEPILKTMNELKFDAMAMGNRELNYLRWVLKNRANQAEFPIITSNVVDDRMQTNNCFSPFKIIQLENLKIGIMGVTPVQYPPGSFWHKIFGLRFFEPVEACKKVLNEISRKVDLTILLSHAGKEMDEKIAMETEGIGLILGAHTHDLID
ncbi:MAG: metallophosphoesterase, partial [Vulcanimicrobiota bacterium]